MQDFAARRKADAELSGNALAGTIPGRALPARPRLGFRLENGLGLDTIKQLRKRGLDILADVARSPFAPQAVVGFAAECESLEAYAREKLERKGARLIIANDVREAAGSAENRILIVSKDATQAFGPAPKRVVAEAVVKAAAAVLG